MNSGSVPRDPDAFFMNLQPVVATDATVRSIELAQVQASRRAAMGSEPLVSHMPFQQALSVAKLGAQASHAVFNVVGVARYEAVAKL